MSDEHVVNGLVAKAWRHRAPTSLVFELKQQGQERLDRRGRHIIAVGALDQGLALDVDDSNKRRHGALLER